MNVAKIVAREWLWLLGSVAVVSIISVGLEWRHLVQARESWPAANDAWVKAKRIVDSARADSYYESAFVPSDKLTTSTVVIGDKTFPPGTRIDEIKASMPAPAGRDSSFKDVREAAEKLRSEPEPPTPPVFRIRHAVVRGLGLGGLLYLAAGLVKVTLASLRVVRAS